MDEASEWKYPSAARTPSPGSDPVEPPTLEITWRELDRGLWVGRAGGAHVGMIEQGHRFTLTDANEGIHRGFPSLTAAQTAATGPIPIQPAARPRAAAPDAPTGPRALLATRSLAMLALALGSLALVSLLLLVV